MGHPQVPSGHIPKDYLWPDLARPLLAEGQGISSVENTGLSVGASPREGGRQGAETQETDFSPLIPGVYCGSGKGPDCIRQGPWGWATAAEEETWPYKSDPVSWEVPGKQT